MTKELEKVIANSSLAFKKSTKKQIEQFLLSPSLFSSVMPKKSKTFFRNFVKIIFEIESHRELILVTNLCFEKMTDTIISKVIDMSKDLPFLTYNSKLKLLCAIEKMHKNLSSDLIHINQLRNKFAHNLFFDLGKMDLKKLSALKELDKKIIYRYKIPKSKINAFFLRLAILIIYDKLCHEYRYLHLLNWNKEI